MNTFSEIGKDIACAVRPTVSIGMPVYNGAKFLAAAISSILAQTFEDFELIISDNGSTDGTEAICRSFAEVDPRIRYIRQPKNLGATNNYNYVFHASSGGYFKWAAHDDLMEPEFLAKCVQVLDQDKRCVLAHPITVLIDEDGQEVTCYLDKMASDSDEPVRRFARWMSPALGQCNPIYGLMRRETIERTRLHGNYMGADRIFLGEMAMLGCVRQVREPLFKRRVHAGMSTLANDDNLTLSEWFSGLKHKGLRFKRLRQILEFARSINRADISAMQRIGCYLVLLKWTWRLRVEVVKELAIPFYANGRPTTLKVWVFRQFGIVRK